MPFPEKFRNLIGLSESQVKVPDYVWLAYAVCAVENDSCGWRGWIIESAWKTMDGVEKELEADAEHIRLMCGKPLFRTEVEKQFRLNPNVCPKIDFGYETSPIKFSRTKKASRPKRRSGR